MIKKSQLINQIKDILVDVDPSLANRSVAEDILSLVEKHMEPKLRSLTAKEIEEHPLVKQVHGSRKNDVRLYVSELPYERKRSWQPEDE